MEGDAVELRLGQVAVCTSTTARGRHLRANQDLNPGVCLIKTPPLAHAVYDAKLGSVCAWTLTAASHGQLRLCSHCRVYRCGAKVSAQVLTARCLKHLSDGSSGAGTRALRPSDRTGSTTLTRRSVQLWLPLVRWGPCATLYGSQPSSSGRGLTSSFKSLRHCTLATAGLESNCRHSQQACMQPQTCLGEARRPARLLMAGLPASEVPPRRHAAKKASRTVWAWSAPLVWPGCASVMWLFTSPQQL